MDIALQTMIDNMPVKTGISLNDWKVILKEKSFAPPPEGVNCLKESHQVTHGVTNPIVTLSKEEIESSGDLVANQYKGKESLLPIYEKLIFEISKFGNDITITSKKGTVSIIRKKQFALIKPATKFRIYLGLKIKDKEAMEKLENVRYIRNYVYPQSANIICRRY